MAKRDKTLEAIFANPIRANIRWEDIESLFRRCGGTVSEGRGSRVRVALNDVVATFHRPHPSPETGKETVKDVRTFLSNAGIEPGEEQ